MAVKTPTGNTPPPNPASAALVPHTFDGPSAQRIARAVRSTERRGLPPWPSRPPHSKDEFYAVITGFMPSESHLTKFKYSWMEVHWAFGDFRTWASSRTSRSGSDDFAYPAINALEWVATDSATIPPTQFPHQPTVSATPAGTIVRMVREHRHHTLGTLGMYTFIAPQPRPRLAKITQVVATNHPRQWRYSCLIVWPSFDVNGELDYTAPLLSPPELITNVRNVYETGDLFPLGSSAPNGATFNMLPIPVGTLVQVNFATAMREVTPPLVYTAEPFYWFFAQNGYEVICT